MGGGVVGAVCGGTDRLSAVSWHEAHQVAAHSSSSDRGKNLCSANTHIQPISITTANQDSTLMISLLLTIAVTISSRAPIARMARTDGILDSRSMLSAPAAATAAKQA